ncbi:hypothetical protein U1Q18_014618 [Sarracenia purpurea var. burkii]
MDEEEMEDSYPYLPIPNPSLFTTKLISFQSDIIHNCFATLLSPLFALLSLLSESFYQAEEAKDSVESAVQAVARVPAKVARGGAVLARKIGVGILGAVYVSMVATMVMGFSVVVGVGLVHLWVEEPVLVREKLYFDYTEIRPLTVFSFADGGGGRGGNYRTKKMGVPVGHTFHVSLVLLLPESDFNRELGVFQLTAELISTRGDTIAKSSQSCMLRYQSLPIRLMRTLLLGIPLLLGITAETQKIMVPILKNKERYPRIGVIRIYLVPRVGTSSVPQVYQAEIIINSELPQSKEIVRRWKWTFCVWTSIYVYIILTIILVCLFKPLILLTTTSIVHREHGEKDAIRQVSKALRGIGGEEQEAFETVRRWQESRSKRKEMLLRGVLRNTIGGLFA